MKVICDRSALLDAVNLVAGLAPVRTPSPALSCVKITASKGPHGGELVLAASDGETALHVSVTAVDVQQAGQAAIVADKLRGIVAAEDGEPTLTLEVIGDQCHIKGANAHFRVFVMPATDFPAIPDLAAAISGGGEPLKTLFTQPAGVLSESISRTIFATARETSRYAINGVLLKRDGKKLEMVATDGRRLALARASVPGGKAAGAAGGGGAGGTGGDAVSCIIPSKALNMVLKLVRDPEDPVRLAITDSRIFFAFDRPLSGKEEKAGVTHAPRAVLSSSLVEGAFPPYEDVIPKDQDKKIVAGRDELTSAVRKASVLTNEESRGVRLSFNKDGKRLKLSSRAPEMGDSEINVVLESYEGDDIEISFNPSFITEVLKVVNEPNVIVELKASNKPGLIRSSANDFIYVVMPVNLPA